MIQGGNDTQGMAYQIARMMSVHNYKPITTANYTILDNDNFGFFVLEDAADANRTITLPTVADNVGRHIIAVNNDATFDFILDGEGGEHINGADDYTLAAQYNAVWIIATPTEWLIIASS